MVAHVCFVTFLAILLPDPAEEGPKLAKEKNKVPVMIGAKIRIAE